MSEPKISPAPWNYDPQHAVIYDGNGDHALVIFIDVESTKEDEERIKANADFACATHDLCTACEELLAFWASIDSGMLASQMGLAIKNAVVKARTPVGQD